MLARTKAQNSWRPPKIAVKAREEDVDAWLKTRTKKLTELNQTTLKITKMRYQNGPDKRTSTPRRTMRRMTTISAKETATIQIISKRKMILITHSNRTNRLTTRKITSKRHNQRKEMSRAKKRNKGRKTNLIIN